MAYATQTDMESRFGLGELVQLTDQAGAGDVDARVLGQAMADADAVIDGHLAGRYELPLASVPPILVGYACDLARERLYKDAPPDAVAKRGDAARRYLRDLATGATTLGVQPEPGLGRPAVVAPARVFDDAGLAGF